MTVEATKAQLERVRWTHPAYQSIIGDEVSISPHIKAMIAGNRAHRSERDKLNRVTALLYSVPGWQIGTAELPPSARSVRSWGGLPSATQTIKHQGRGIGLRFSNVREVLAGAAEEWPMVGLYAVDVDLTKVKNQSRRWKASARASQLLVEAHAVIRSPQEAAERVERHLGESELAMYDQPPSSVELQRARGIKPCDEGMLYVLRSEAECIKLGEISMADLRPAT